MKRLRFLLLDANVIIRLFELSLWKKIVETCDIIVAETVVEEAEFFFDDEGQHAIDLSADIKSNRITIASVPASDVAQFRDRFSPDYLERIDPGEAEALAFLLSSNDPCLLCSADAIVFRILGRLNRGEQGLSLEEVLDRVGLSRGLPNQFRKEARDRWTKQGQQDMIQHRGLK